MRNVISDVTLTYINVFGFYASSQSSF